MERRLPEPDDQDLAAFAFALLEDLFNKYQPLIESALWVGPMIAVLADSAERSDIPFNEFKKMMEETVEFYKY